MNLALKIKPAQAPFSWMAYPRHHGVAIHTTTNGGGDHVSCTSATDTVVSTTSMAARKDGG
eukprot:CAMPEP_0183356350 /NCGR_PEP_ID=MMETSP0164_2-20130417/44082_1 /TAXON_ID=221442 /ORGANISM="Coccolithus pelagicus ssp braarudi, Strain PLY182g" /LENGTH=60 /DNA_ID=CAMNT_0025529739 /DNA_START=684 /DNA_END=862 /DNA_ORIENTATION=-